MDSKQDKWKTITKEFAIGTTANRWQMSPTLPMDGDWMEMELTVEEVSGDMTELKKQRLNYDSSLNQYVASGNNTSSPIIYTAIKDGDMITITRVKGVGTSGSSFSRSIKAVNIGLWIHWGALTNELKVKGTVRYK